jgi:hypothetical protein
VRRSTGSNEMLWARILAMISSQEYPPVATICETLKLSYTKALRAIRVMTKFQDQIGCGIAASRAASARAIAA